MMMAVTAAVLITGHSTSDIVKRQLVERYLRIASLRGRLDLLQQMDEQRSRLPGHDASLFH
jgi:hypothetical protein